MPPAQCQQRGGRGQRSALSPQHQHQLLRLLFLVMVTGSVQGSIDIPSGYNLEDMIRTPPEITEQPESALVFSVEDIKLNCEATGVPPPSYRWEKDGELFAQLEDDGTLTALNNSMPLDLYEGNYRCYASNDLGTAVSDLVKVTAAYVPTATREKTLKYRKNEGESLVMPCDPPPNTPPHKIYWMDQEVQRLEMSDRVTPGLDGYLYFANVIPSDTRKDYTCNVRFGLHMIAKEPVDLKVNPNGLVEEHKPQIQRPVSKTESPHLALRGENYILECIPSGFPTPTVTWRRKNGDRAVRHKIDNNGRWLHFRSVSESDDGEYECIAENSAGKVSHTYLLTVEAAPYFPKSTKNLMYAPGETVLLECQAEGIPTPVVTWSINGVPISEVNEPRRKITKGALILSDVKAADTAVYQCEAVNKHGISLLNLHINVIELPPQILTEDQKKYMMVEGKTANLECKVFGSPRPKVSWQDERKEPAQSHNRMSQTVEGSLTIIKVSAADSGIYTCDVLNSNLSISAILEVLNRTEILTPPKDQRVKSGENAVLTCRFQVDPKLYTRDLLRWLKNGEDVSENAQNDKYTIFEDGSLKITSVSSEDAGSYTCEVETALDAEKATATITVVDKPSPPIDLNISEKTARSVTLSWTPGQDNNSPITDYHIEMKEEQHGDGHTWEEVKHVEADINEVEVRLRPYGTYRFRVIAENEIGRGRPSHESDTYITPPAIPEHSPRHLKSASTDPESLIITWEEMDKREHYGPDFMYKVFWRQSVGNGPEWHHQLVSHNRFVVNDTKTFTPFEMKVQAINSIGSGPESTSRIGHSGEDTPLEAPTDVSVQDLNGTSILVKWKPVTQESVRGHLLGYRIRVKKLDPQALQSRKMLEIGWSMDTLEELKQEVEQDRTVVAHGNKGEEIVGGLHFYSSYQLTVAAFNSKGDGPESESKNFETPEGVPGPPIFDYFEYPSETELILFWHPPRQRNGRLTGYKLQYGEIKDAEGSSLQMHEVALPEPDITRFTVMNLTPQRQYYFYLQALTAVGPGEAIKVKGATLLDGVPPSLINVTTSENYANLSWVPSDKHRSIDFHIHFLRSSDLQKDGKEYEVSEQVSSNQGFFQLSNLQPGTRYELRAILNNSSYWEGYALTSGPELSQMPNHFASQGWFIGLISAVVLLLLILLILCLIKRSKGGKYSVKDKEEGQGDSEARPMKDEAFGEYSDNDEKRTMSQPSLCVESKLGSDDSLAEYGDSVDIQFNEDGSFIGQYSGRREAPLAHGGQESSGATSPVNNMPPQSISFNNSVTGILDRSN